MINKILYIKVIFKNIENKLKTFQVPKQTFSTKHRRAVFKNYSQKLLCKTVF